MTKARPSSDSSGLPRPISHPPQHPETPPKSAIHSNSLRDNVNLQIEACSCKTRVDEPEGGADLEMEIANYD
ncbi:hypothetical protein BGW80DRAFT_1404973 [Lactifluus volemus]|nr:hypothetical protein BGW80DRAFT_1404973 [Lactifluus volemus]